MKKFILTGIIAGICVLSFYGCEKETSKTDRPALTQNIATYSAPEITDSQTVSKENNSTVPPDNSGMDVYNFSYYEEQINKLSKKVNDAQPTSDYETNSESFYQLKTEIDDIENNLDAVGNLIENNYKADKLSFEQYRIYEKTLDALEDSLDFVEEALENKFNIDD